VFLGTTAKSAWQQHAYPNGESQMEQGTLLECDNQLRRLGLLHAEERRDRTFLRQTKPHNHRS